MTDYKELCAELVTELEGWCGTGTYDNTVNAHSVIDRARAALAQPEPEGPTDEELVNFRNRATADCCISRSNNGVNLLSGGDCFECQAAGLRAVLAKWGHQ
jgi:hypothetical protein